MSFQFSAYQIAELAAEVEDASTNFYKRFAVTTQDQAIRETFNLLAQQEAGHRNAFAGMAKALKGEDEEREYAIDLYGMLKYTLDKLKNTAFPASTSARPKDIIETLEVAVRSEEISVDVYTQLRNTLSERFHEIIDGILQVEQYHCKYVSDLRNKISSV